MVVVTADVADDGEDADVHRGIARRRRSWRRRRPAARSGEGDEQIAGVRDGGVGQHALDVLLAQRARLPTVMESNRENPEEAPPMLLDRGVGAIEDAQQNREGGGLGRGGHERDDRRRRAFVDVGRPDLEGRGGDLEAEADQDHERWQSRRGSESWLCGSAAAMAAMLRCSRCAEDQRDSVEEECGGEGAEQEVLDCRFGALACALAEAGEDVGGDRRDFEADEDQQQFDGARS